MATPVTSRGKAVFLAVAALFALPSCGQVPEGDPESEAPPTEESRPPFMLIVSDVGFSTPESVLHDPEADVYLVTNINGSATDHDGNGFISRVSPEGRVLERAWIDGADPGVTLDAPKGMAIVGDTLFVTDIDCIRRFDRLSGAPFQDLCLEEATFLNDITADHRGDLYFTDSGTNQAPGAVYFLRQTADVPQKVALADGTLLEGEDLGGPNGVFADRRGLYVTTFGSGEIFRVTPEGERLQMIFPSEMGLDGIVCLEERGFLFTSWGDSAVYWIHSDGTVTALAENLEAPADLGYDATRNRALIPLFQANELVLLEVK